MQLSESGKQIALVFRLALKDLLRDRALTLCLVISLAATATPLVILAGLRDGLVAGLRSSLLEDPRTREIVSASNRDYTAHWIETLASRPEIAFVMPRTRTLAASASVYSNANPDHLRTAQMIPTRPGDPLLVPEQIESSGSECIVSASLAASLHVHRGDHLTLAITRFGPSAGTARTTLLIKAVAPERATALDTIFVRLGLAQAAEIYRESDESWADATRQAENSPEKWPGFRLYVRRLEDVPQIDQSLRAAGIDIASRAGEVSRLLELDRRLTLLLLLTGALGCAGFLTSLAATQWANIARKKQALAILRFLGVARLSLFPLTQALLLACAGMTLALLGASFSAHVINRAFSEVLPDGRPLCAIEPGLVVDLVALTLLSASLSAIAAMTRIARIDPWKGLSAS